MSMAWGASGPECEGGAEIVAGFRRRQRALGLLTSETVEPPRNVHARLAARSPPRRLTLPQSSRYANTQCRLSQREVMRCIVQR